MSAISIADIKITNAEKQQDLTGKTTKQSLKDINTDTKNTHTQAELADANAAKGMANIKQSIKQELSKQVYKEAVKFTDKAYQVIFLTEHPIYREDIDSDGVITYVKLTIEQAKHLKKSADGKIHLAVNGIFNDKYKKDKDGNIIPPTDTAGKYASQHKSGDIQYLMHFPEADIPDGILGAIFGNKLAELSIVAYQKMLEDDFGVYLNLPNNLKILP